MSGSAPPPVRLDSITVVLDQEVVLRRLSLELAPGLITALVGPSGAGKTTLCAASSGCGRRTRDGS